MNSPSSKGFCSDLRPLPLCRLWARTIAVAFYLFGFLPSKARHSRSFNFYHLALVHSARARCDERPCSESGELALAHGHVHAWHASPISIGSPCNSERRTRLPSTSFLGASQHQALQLAHFSATRNWLLLPPPSPHLSTGGCFEAVVAQKFTLGKITHLVWWHGFSWC